MRVVRSVLVLTALAIHLTGCGNGQPSSLTLQLPEHAQVWRWEIVKAGSPDEVVQSVTDGTRTVEVPPGNYQVAIQQNQHFSGRVVWPQTIRIKRNQQEVVSVQSGISLQVPENTRLWRWQIVTAGSPEEVVQWTTSPTGSSSILQTLLIPPGEYQVTIQPDQHFSGRVVWPTPVRVENDQPAVAALQSGVKLTVRAKAKIWRWQVVRAGAPDEIVQWTTSSARTLLVPPGEYQVVVQPEQHNPVTVVWPQAEPLVVSDGQIAQATLDLRAANNTEASGSATP
jgi:hypothetical protein